MKNRSTWTNWDYNVVCQDCGWAVQGKNGLGVAAQHHDRTGHTVHVDVEGVVQYLSDKDHEQAKRDRGDLL